MSSLSMVTFGAICFVCVLGAGVSSEILVGSNETTHMRSKRGLVPKTVCYRGLGCFNSGPPFQQFPNRIISLTPLPPERIRTTYLLYTRKNRNNPFSFDPSTLHTLGDFKFNPLRWTRIVVHGFLDGTYTTSWPMELKDAILDFADENVIFVDHSIAFKTALRIVYMQSVADTRVIGAQIANLISFLNKTYGVDLAKVHIIGHSLGAEIAGYAGERLQNLGRITGLDPAGPEFRQHPNIVKLDPADATFVDTIHSNPVPYVLFGFGTLEDRGHSNFWPNGGKIKGCSLSFIRVLFTGIPPFEPASFVFNCRHRRAIEIFLFSITQKDCFFVGVECTSYADFLQGKCDCGQSGQKCSFMGIHAEPRPLPRKKYYTQIGLERPYCLHQYQVSVFLKTSGVFSKSIRSGIVLTIFAEQVIQKKLELNVDLTIQKQVNTFLITTFQRLGKIHSVHISLDESIRNSSMSAVEALTINYLFPASKEETEVTLCPPTSEDQAHQKNEFSSTHCHRHEAEHSSE